MKQQTKDIPKGYKMTELGPLPEEWEVAELGDLFAIQQGKALSPKHREGKSPHPFLRTANVLWGRLDLTTIDEMDFTDKELERLSLRYNDLLICEGGDIGRTAIWRGEIAKCSYQNHIHRVRAIDSNVEPTFFMYWMQAALTLLGLYMGTANRTTIANLSKSRLSKFNVPKPPLPEQKKIASVLSTVQQAKEKTAGAIAALGVLKKSLMKHLFTYGPVPVDEAENVELKETEIGEIPDEWDVVELGALFQIQQGKALSPKHREGKSPYPFLRTANVLWGRLDLTVIDEMDFTEDELSRLSLQYNDLLICEGGDIGRTAIWQNEIPGCSYQNHIHRVRPYGSDVEPKYYMYWMQAAITLLGLYVGTGNRTTIANLSKSRLSRYNVPKPSHAKQRKIAEMLSAVDTKLDTLENEKQALDDLFRTLLHDLMTARIRVNEAEVPV